MAEKWISAVRSPQWRVMLRALAMLIVVLTGSVAMAGSDDGRASRR
jgi:hypothetical protein